MKYEVHYKFFRRLSNPNRIRIIYSLCDKEKSVSDLSNELKIEQSKLSHALRELKNCNILKVRKDGKKRIYYLSSTIKPILRLISIHGEKHCGRNKCKIS